MEAAKELLPLVCLQELGLFFRQQKQGVEEVATSNLLEVGEWPSLLRKEEVAPFSP